MVEGRCNCGGIKVRLAELPKKSIICYCSNCRRAGSSIASFVFVIDRTEVEVNDPNRNLKSYTDSDTKSGKSIIRKFCSQCGCPIMSLIKEDSPQFILKSGIFEQIPPPSVRSFPQEEPTWIKLEMRDS